jgi:hypothetical protein
MLFEVKCQNVIIIRQICKVVLEQQFENNSCDEISPLMRSRRDEIEETANGGDRRG